MLVRLSLCSLILTMPLTSPVADPPAPLDEPELAAAPRLADSIRISAHLMTAELEVGLIEGVSISDAGIPAPLLQIDLPPSIELEGKVLETYDELAANGFLNAPFERVLEEVPATVRFKLKSEPKANETIGLNITGYVTGKDGAKGFLRRRLELPLEAESSALEVDARKSTWGINRELLQIGDRAPDFTLPRADGSELSLSHYLGQSKILVSTYRAH